jgi:hypothetical protein
MITFFWILCLLSFLGISVVLLWTIFNQPHARESLSVLIEGFKEGLRGSGLGLNPKKYTTELWRWELSETCKDCDDCIERSLWEPMDIADWMKEGLPRTVEADTECGDKCGCQIVPVKPQFPFRQRQKNN